MVFFIATTLHRFYYNSFFIFFISTYIVRYIHIFLCFNCFLKHKLTQQKLLHFTMPTDAAAVTNSAFVDVTSQPSTDHDIQKMSFPTLAPSRLSSILTFQSFAYARTNKWTESWLEQMKKLVHSPLCWKIIMKCFIRFLL